MTLHSKLYRRSEGIMVAYDVADRQSFDRVQHWHQDAQRYMNEGTRVMLVGCKCDQASRREVDYGEGQRLADALGVPFAETSAATGAGVKAAFTAMVRAIRGWETTSAGCSSLLLEHLPKAAAPSECARAPSASFQQSAGAMVVKGSYAAVLPAVQALCKARTDVRMKFEEAMGQRLFPADGSEHIGNRASDVSQATRALADCARASLAGATASWGWEDLKRMMEDVNMAESAAAAVEISIMNERYRGEASTNAANCWEAACNASAPFRLARVMTLAMLQKGAKKDPKSAWAALIVDDFSVAPSMEPHERDGGCVLCHSRKKPFRALFTEKEKNRRYPACGDCMRVAISCNALRTLKSQLVRFHRDRAKAASLAHGVAAHMFALWSAFVNGSNQVKTFGSVSLGECMKHVAPEYLFVPPGDPLFRGGAPAEALGSDAAAVLDSDDELDVAMKEFDSDHDEQLDSDNDEEGNEFADAVAQLVSNDTIESWDSDGDEAAADAVEEFSSDDEEQAPDAIEEFGSDDEEGGAEAVEEFDSDDDDDEIMADVVEELPDECSKATTTCVNSDSEGGGLDEDSSGEEALDSDDECALAIGKRVQHQHAGEGPPRKRR